MLNFQNCLHISEISLSPLLNIKCTVNSLTNWFLSLPLDDIEHLLSEVDVPIFV
jgi:hypothetical protein